MRATAYRVPWQIGVAIAAVVTSAALGVAVAQGTIVIAGSLIAVLTLAITLSLWGRVVLPLTLIVVVPLIPVAGDPPAAGASSARLAVMVLLVAAGLLLHTQSGQRLRSVEIRSLVTALLVFAVLGMLVAMSDGTGGQDLLKTLSLTSGQPLAYAGFLALFAVALQSKERSRQDLLRAWAVVMIVEGLYVALQFATGSAYDPIRGFSRGQGTTGADFLGAFAAISFFGALALRSIEQSMRGRLLAWAAMIAAAGSQLASTSRGSLVGLSLGLGYLLVQRHRGGVAGSRRSVALVLLLIAIIGGGLYATKGLWLSRLDARPTTNFDRPTTWASGLRIARDHPWTGVGPTKLASLIENDPRYSDTQYGRTTSVPHDMWIFALAVGGLPYGLGAVWLVFVLSRVLRQAYRRNPSQEVLDLRAALVAALPVFVINNVFTHPEVMIVVMLAIALLVVSPKTDVRATGRSTAPRLAWARRESIPVRP
jgi:O-antigen ligase